MTDQKSDDARGVTEPQVIDLTAEEIKSQTESPQESAEEVRLQAESLEEKADAAESLREEVEPERTEPSPPPPPPPPHIARPARKRSVPVLWVIAALLLGLLGGGWLYRNQLSNYFPTDEMAAMRVRIDTLETQAQTLNNQIAATGQSIDGANQAAAAASEQAKAVDANVTALSALVDATDQRVAATEQALEQARTDLSELRKSISTSGTGTNAGGTVDNAALAALGQRLDQLEKDVASLKSAGGGGDTASVTSALSQALSDLKAKVAAGTGYAAEYDRIARMVPAAPGLEVLANSAQDGLPGAQGLAQELRAAIPALPQPEAPAPEGDSYWDSLLDSLSGIITVRQIGEANWPQLAERAAAFAEAGDLTQAISTVDGAEGEKPMALTQWRDRAAARIRLEAALEQVSDAVLRQIAALGGAK